MTRPQFLTSPGSWIRTGSRPTDAVRDACAIECHGAPWKLRELLFIVVVAALGLIGWIVSAGGI